MNFKLILLLLLLIAFAISFGLWMFRKVSVINYVPSAYENEMIQYLKEVALNLEYEAKPIRVFKWKNTICIYIVNSNPEFMKIVQGVVDEINELIPSGLKMEISDNQMDSNFVLYLCTMDSISKLNKGFYEAIKSHHEESEVHGFSTLSVDWSQYEIYNAYIYVDPNDPLNEQECTILEEITQCIGLPNDSEKYPNSVFFQHKSEYGLTTNEYSNIDKDVIQLLYHPRIKAGMNAKQVERAIMKILQNKDIKLYGS